MTARVQAAGLERVVKVSPRGVPYCPMVGPDEYPSCRISELPIEHGACCEWHANDLGLLEGSPA